MNDVHFRWSTLPGCSCPHCAYCMVDSSDRCSTVSCSKLNNTPTASQYSSSHEEFTPCFFLHHKAISSRLVDCALARSRIPVTMLRFRTDACRSPRHHSYINVMKIFRTRPCRKKDAANSESIVIGSADSSGRSSVSLEHACFYGGTGPQRTDMSSTHFL